MQCEHKKVKTLVQKIRETFVMTQLIGQWKRKYQGVTLQSQVRTFFC